MKDPQWLTVLSYLSVRYAALPMLIFIDVFLFRKHGIHGTFSAAMARAGRENPVLAYFLGFVDGALVFGVACHFWWSVPNKPPEPPLPVAVQVGEPSKN